MDSQIEKALIAALSNYAAVVGKQEEQAVAQLATVFRAEGDFLEKVKLMDQAFDRFPEFEDLREVVFDLLMMNFLSADVQRLEADYLDSPEWEVIEEDTLDRGTELLNILLYIHECHDNDIEPDLDDFLKEFLLVEEDEFQDEHRIYESLIANQLLVDSDYKEIARIAGQIDEEEEMATLFYPVMSFFNEPAPSEALFAQYLAASEDKGHDAAIYALLSAFNKK